MDKKYSVMTEKMWTQGREAVEGATKCAWQQSVSVNSTEELVALNESLLESYEVEKMREEK